VVLEKIYGIQDKMSSRLSIIVPCYNEANTVVQLLEKLFSIDLGAWKKEIIIVDDASTDSTRELLERYEGRAVVVLQKINGGKGSAVQAGLTRATGDYVLIQDADLEYEPRDIPALLEGLTKAAVVYGSRNLRPRERAGAYIPRMGVWFITKLINMLYGLSLTDVWTCYKLFPRDAGEDFKAGRFESELLFTAALKRRGYRFTEVPIKYHPREFFEGKKIRYSDGIYAIFVIIKDWMIHL
jgi:glycosyltransferase involved in cell wall biosynthesis